MSKKSHVESVRSVAFFAADPTECPFREFRDHELSPDYWGLGPAACRAAVHMSSKAPKPHADFVWVDDQTQPLPRSVRQYLHGWVRADQLARSRWEADVVVYEENNGSTMNVMDIQLSHTQVLMRSMFCRKVLSACFVLERVEGLTVEHQWDNFVFSFGPEGWRAKCHIYSPGMKAGGGAQHRPVLSKNGCYLVRLYHLGAWRCVWVSDQIPVDATEAPLLPFSPLLSRAPLKPGVKAAPAAVTANVVYLWPLLICKALLKLAAPDMSSDEELDSVEDELMPDLDIFHALTGCMSISYHIKDPEYLWKLMTAQIQVFGWDEDDDTLTSTIKSKSTKKTTAKEAAATKGSLLTITIEDTKDLQPYVLPGITPAHETILLVTMARDLPLKKPLSEPEIALWKQYRWIHWAKKHGLYEAYDCPRTRFLKVNGLMKLSYAPHLLDVQSTDSITFGYRQEHDKTDPPPPKKGAKGEINRSQTVVGTKATSVNPELQIKEELRQWMQYEQLRQLMKQTTILYFPSMFQLTTATSNPPIRVKAQNRALDIQAPKGTPLYLQIDGPQENKLKLSLNTLHPRVLNNCGRPVVDYIEPAYLLLEKFDWFEDCTIPKAKAFVETRGYNSVEVTFSPGRHYCRLWVHSRTNWHVMLLSESTLLLGTRDVIQSASVRECPWAARFLNNLSAAFTNWIRVNRSNTAMTFVTTMIDRDFYKSYKPDLNWDHKIIGYSQAHLHWMFRQALQSLLSKKLPALEFKSVCKVLRYYFCDPNFGLPLKPNDKRKSLREVIVSDLRDCILPEPEEAAETEENLVKQIKTEECLPVNTSLLDKLLAEPVDAICDLATDDTPCGILKNEREKVIRRHEAATLIQAYWRGSWARKCLENKVTFTADVLKYVMDNAFGNLEALSALMNEFFKMFPGAKSAYTVASALSGVNGLFQHHSSSPITPKCKWIPYFQGVFYCHAPVKVHFDIHNSLQHSTTMVYNNDTGEQMPQVYNADITYEFSPNNNGYAVLGHGSLSQPSGTYSDAHWQLTVLSSIQGAFHVCDNDIDGCKELPLQGSSKVHIDEIFVPNRRNILGGILLSATKHEAVSFRAAAASPELEMVATLCTISAQGDTEVLAHCKGTGEIYWPYIQLKPNPAPEVTTFKKLSTSHANLNLSDTSGIISNRSLPKGQTKGHKVTIGAKNKSITKIKPLNIEAKHYSIEVSAPGGWPLTLAQWMKVDELRNSTDFAKIDAPRKLTKPVSAKDKDKVVPVSSYAPQADDAFTELECSLCIGGGTNARRDDRKDLQFAAARKTWAANEPGRNLRGAQIRDEFRAEFLESLSAPTSESLAYNIVDETIGEEMETERDHALLPQGPTPATESGILEMTEGSEDEPKYILMPEQLKDKFIPLYFLPFCMKERSEDERAFLSNDMAEAAKQDRLARIEAGFERMRELQEYNDEYVIKQQRRRCQLLEALFVDSQLSPALAEALNKRDDAIAQETLNRTISANKKKQELKTGRK